MKRILGIATLFCMVLVFGLVTAPVGAAEAPGNGGGDPGGGGVPIVPVQIATGPDNSAEGYLEVSPDDYGSFGAFGIINGFTEDRFNPTGFFLEQTTFTSGLYLFVGSASRELLSDMQEWQDTLGADGDVSLTRAVTAPNVASDTNADTVDDTLNSSFRVDGAGTALAFDLVQSVSSADPGVAILRQTYSILNEGDTTTILRLVRSYDGDLLWSGDFANDEVGTTMHGAGQGTYVFQQEDSDPGVTAVTLSGATGRNYHGCKNGVQPGNGPPPCGFGTDLQLWDAFGIPPTWENFLAGVGYDTNGESGVAPPGSIDPADAGMGMDWEVALAPGESTDVTMLHTYGQAFPTPGCVLGARVSRRVRSGGRLPVTMTIEHNRPQTVTVPFSIWVEDQAGNVITSTSTGPITLTYGERIERSYGIRIPADVPPGAYNLMIGMREMQQGEAKVRRSFRVR